MAVAAASQGGGAACRVCAWTWSWSQKGPPRRRSPAARTTSQTAIADQAGWRPGHSPFGAGTGAGRFVAGLVASPGPMGTLSHISVMRWP